MRNFMTKFYDIYKTKNFLISWNIDPKFNNLIKTQGKIPENSIIRQIHKSLANTPFSSIF